MDRSGGEAAKVKALVNMVMNINTAGLSEGLALAEALGLDLSMVREIFSQTGANSRVLETDGADMQTREHDVFFSAAHAAKDSRTSLELSVKAGLSLPLAEATARQYERMVELGLGGDRQIGDFRAYVPFASPGGNEWIKKMMTGRRSARAKCLV